MLDKITKLFKRNQKLPEFKGFAPTHQVMRLRRELQPFLKDMFDFDFNEILISDESTLSDFLGVTDDTQNMNDMIQKVKKIYDLDITQIKDEPIVVIVDYLQKNKKDLHVSSK